MKQTRKRNARSLLLLLQELESPPAPLVAPPAKAALHGDPPAQAALPEDPLALGVLPEAPLARDLALGVRLAAPLHRRSLLLLQQQRRRRPPSPRATPSWPPSRLAEPPS